jgi:hypothetical protein
MQTQDLVGQTTRCHWHFNKKKYSVSLKTEKGWRVVRDEQGNQVLYGKLVLQDAKFLVSEAGHKRCVEQGVRNVHAHVEGKVLDANLQGLEPMVPCGRYIYYNPFIAGYFWYTDGLSISRRVDGVDYLSMGILSNKASMLGVGFG